MRKVTHQRMIEISVFLNIPRIGGTEIDAVIVGELLYLPITDLFDFLRIRNIPDSDLESITGFFINPDAVYSISRLDNQIKYQNITTTLQSRDLIRTESNLFLKSDYFGKVFGLECTFNFRSLSVTINSKLDLPLIREMRQEEMRKNLTRLKGKFHSRYHNRKNLSEVQIRNGRLVSEFITGNKWQIGHQN